VTWGARLTSRGELVPYGNPAFYQSVVRDAILRKSRAPIYRDRYIDVLALVSDSPHEIEDSELAFGTDEALRMLGTSCPFGFVVGWWAPYLRFGVNRSGNPMPPSRAAQAVVDALSH